MTSEIRPYSDKEPLLTTHTSKCSLSDLFNSEKRDTVEDDMYHSELKRQNSLDVFLQRLESQVGANITDDNSKKKMLNNQVQLLVKNNPKLKSKMDDIEYRAIHNGQTALDEPEEIYSVGQNNGYKDWFLIL